LKNKNTHSNGHFHFSKCPELSFFSSHYLHVILVRYHRKNKNKNHGVALEQGVPKKIIALGLILGEFLFQQQPTPQVPDTLILKPLCIYRQG
jgi:hypothetical protein